ncbi:MAG: hypothetical protein ACR2KP_00675 [Egibacteraceae bacterium]
MKRQKDHDALLSWCSEIGSATIDEFRRACRALELPVNRSARDLSQLGHVEFDWNRGRFAVAPTTLTTVPDLPGRLLLTGARPYGLIADLAQTAEHSELDVDVWRDLRHQFGTGPSTAFIDADPSDAPRFCAEAGIRWAACASAEIAGALPPLDRATATVAHRPDSRFPHATVDAHSFRVRWDEDVPDGREGLWLYRTWGRRRQMILCAGEAEPRMILDTDNAPYLMARPADADPIVEYRRSHRLLVVNAAAPLPALAARSVCLCSGRLPIRKCVAPEIAYNHYVNVDPPTAERILRTLGVAV